MLFLSIAHDVARLDLSEFLILQRLYNILWMRVHSLCLGLKTWLKHNFYGANADVCFLNAFKLFLSMAHVVGHLDLSELLILQRFYSICPEADLVGYLGRQLLQGFTYVFECSSQN